MAVLKSKRGESSVQFLDTAFNIEEFTIRQCMKLPKRSMFFVGERTVNLASEMAECLRRANTIYLDSAEKFDARARLLMQANQALQCLISKVNLISRLYPESLSANILCEWSEMLVEEFKLIAKLKKSDSERKKKLLSGESQN